MKKALSDIRITITIEIRLRDKITQEGALHKFGRAVDADAIAGHITAVIQGMSILARDGASQEELVSIAATAMMAWPS